MSFLSRYEALGASFDPSIVNVRGALRINTIRIGEEEAVASLKAKGVGLESIPHIPCGYWYEAPFSLGATPEYLQGWYYLQEAASQLPPLVLSLSRGDVILDMAAAPGSKTTQIAQLIDDEGVIVALDTELHRLESLRNNVERMGVSCAVLYKKDARFASDLGLKFDKVLLDAPCSGNFCIEPEYFTTKTLDGIRQRSRLQRELLKSAYKVLRKGGTLVYSTCSLEPEEDELVIDWFLKRYDDLSLEETGLSMGDPGLVSVFGESLHPSLSLTRRFWPHKTGTQGFFIARLVKS